MKTIINLLDAALDDLGKFKQKTLGSYKLTKASNFDGLVFKYYSSTICVINTEAYPYTFVLSKDGSGSVSTARTVNFMKSYFEKKGYRYIDIVESLNRY